MHTKRITTKIAGVTFEGRQAVIATLTGTEAVQIRPEPENPYDANALAVFAATSDGVKQIGYVPRYLAAEIAPLLDGERVIATIHSIVGGFETRDGETASLGILVTFEYPSDEGDL